ncbi:hypothetical protein BAUCODRAFT_68256, partial [Baudoinia panamericana UAMH 10762]
GTRSPKRRRSGEYSSDSFTARLSRHWPSISRRWKEHRASLSVTSISNWSAPPSRSSSVRLPSFRRSVIAPVEPVLLSTPPFTPIDNQPVENAVSRPRALSRPNKPADIQIPDQSDDFADGQELVSTPLLPPVTAELSAHAAEEVQSPLQSPSIAAPSVTGSILGTPVMTPVHTSMPTPPLSSKPSMVSFGRARSTSALLPFSEIPPMAISEETDEWAFKLGHANFHIKPDPYLPEHCSPSSCKELLKHWESARKQIMEFAARFREEYGSGSPTFKLMEQKWAELDDRWRAYYEKAAAEAGVNTDDINFRPLAESPPLVRVPSLNEPEHPPKFPGLDDVGIVGPMVAYANTYAKAQSRPSRKPAILKLFTDPASLLGGRSAFGIRR